ncbi:MAG TPA: ADOP family duplicated permease [Acidobacteriota bacterium]|nr:ADOP family duplicated permease [Acidobacteriota bacterium]
MSQNRWAQKLGLSSGHLSELVNGKRPYPSAETRQILLQGLNLNFRQLFQVEDATEVEEGDAREGSPSNDRVRDRSLVDLRLGPVRLRLDRVRSPMGKIARRGDSLMHSILQDIRFGLRTLRKSPAFTAVALLALALGIGGNTAIFSLLNAVILRPLPFPDSDRLVMLWETEEGNPRASVSAPNLDDWLESAEGLESGAAIRNTNHTLRGQGPALRIEASRVSGTFFQVLGVEPQVGRLFRPEDDPPENPPLRAVVSHGFWQTHLGGASNLENQGIDLDGKRYQVIGVLPRGFNLPALTSADIYLPLNLDAAMNQNRGNHMYGALARLSEGATLTQVQSQLDAAAESIERRFPDSQAGRGVRADPLQQALVGDAREPLVALSIAVGFVLLIACANVANLLLARASARRREIAIRSALGAGRLRLMRQLLAESLLLSLTGGVLGVALALAVLELLRPAADLPRVEEASVDPWVLLFSLMVSLLAGVLFGLAPAWLSPRKDVRAALVEGGRHQGDASGSGLRGALVAAEVALAVILLLGAGIFVRSFAQLTSVESGFETQGRLIFFNSSPFSADFENHGRLEFYQQLSEKIEGLPGVERAATGLILPLTDAQVGTGLLVKGREYKPGEEPQARYNSVSPGYFEAMGIPLIRGRLLEPGDRLGQPGAMLINETAARRYFPDSDPIGQFVQPTIGLGDPQEPDSYQIVGIVGDVRQAGLHLDPEPQYYVSVAQQTWPMTAFVVKTQLQDPTTLRQAIRMEAARLDRGQALHGFAAMSSLLDDNVAQRRFVLTLLGAFASVALLLAAVGIYGVISYSVQRRLPEIGVRMALGALRADVVKLVLHQALKPVVAGLIIGGLGALLLIRLVQSQLYQVDTVDPLTYLAATALLLFSALLACTLPAWRASKVDPLRSLRTT